MEMNKEGPLTELKLEGYENNLTIKIIIIIVKSRYSTENKRLLTP